jgi:hypothetical protein
VAAAAARLKIWGYESPVLTMPELTESEQVTLSVFTLGQRIRYHAQRQREWIVELEAFNNQNRLHFE